MRKTLITFLLFPLILNTLQAQNEKSVVVFDNIVLPLLKSFRDNTSAVDIGYDEKSGISRLRTFYSSGKIKSVHYYNKEALHHGREYQYNKLGEVITLWDYDNGKLIARAEFTGRDYSLTSKEKIHKALQGIYTANEILKKEPNKIYAYLYRAYNRKLVGNTFLAIEDYKNVLNMHFLGGQDLTKKDLSDIHSGLAYCYSEFEMDNYTIHHYLEAIKTNPKGGYNHINLANHLVELKEYELAKNYYLQAKEIYPDNNPFVHAGLAEIALEEEEYEKGMEYINIAFSNEENLYQAGIGDGEKSIYSIRGMLHHKLGNSKEGIKSLEAGLKRNKNESYAHRCLGVIYGELEEFEKSCEYLKKAEELGYKKIHDTNELEEFIDSYCIEQSSFKKLTEINPVVSPNPAIDFINIDKVDVIGSSYLIFDYTGKQVMTGEFNSKKLDIQKLQSGVYILKINRVDKMYTLRFIKQ